MNFLVKRSEIMGNPSSTFEAVEPMIYLVKSTKLKEKWLDRVKECLDLAFLKYSQK